MPFPEHIQAALERNARALRERKDKDQVYWGDTVLNRSVPAVRPSHVPKDYRAYIVTDHNSGVAHYLFVPPYYTKSEVDMEVKQRGIPDTRLPDMSELGDILSNAEKRPAFPDPYDSSHGWFNNYLATHAPPNPRRTYADHVRETAEPMRRFQDTQVGELLGRSIDSDIDFDEKAGFNRSDVRHPDNPQHHLTQPQPPSDFDPAVGRNRSDHWLNPVVDLMPRGASDNQLFKQYKDSISGYNKPFRQDYRGRMHAQGVVGMEGTFGIGEDGEIPDEVVRGWWEEDKRRIAKKKKDEIEKINESSRLKREIFDDMVAAGFDPKTLTWNTPASPPLLPRRIVLLL
jgi:hypothetical protein